MQPMTKIDLAPICVGQDKQMLLVDRKKNFMSE